MITGWVVLLGLVVLPVALSFLFGRDQATALSVYGVFAQIGSLVFGGGHVVLPMLQAEVVGPGWMNDQQFLAGYGVTQAMPGPIFTLSAFLGAIAGANRRAGWGPFSIEQHGVVRHFYAKFWLYLCLYPLWDRLRGNLAMRRALQGINAAVVGLLLAALYDPVWTKAMAVDNQTGAVAVVMGAWLLLSVWKIPAWAVVLLSSVAGIALAL